MDEYRNQKTDRSPKVGDHVTITSHGKVMRFIVAKVNQAERTVSLREYSQGGRVLQTRKNVSWDSLKYDE